MKETKKYMSIYKIHTNYNLNNLFLYVTLIIYKNIMGRVNNVKNSRF